MNRLELPLAPMSVPTHTVDWAHKVDWETPESNPPLRVVGVRHREFTTGNDVTFLPVHYESGYAYPLVVWLHGAEQSPRCLAEVMAHVSTRNYVAIAPASSGKEQATTSPWHQSPSAIADSEQRIADAVKHAQQRFSVHPNRVFLVGFGTGGTMALRVAMQSPRLFAGVASVGGPLPTGYCPFRRVNEIRNLPFLLSAARRSSQFTDQEVCSNLRLLHSAGAMVSLRQYPGVDELTTQMLADLDRWMMELVGQSNAAVVR